MRFLGEYLATAGGFTVAGPRLAGHGTTPDEMGRSTAEEWIRDLEAAMAALQERCDHIFVAGLSMGGTLTLYMAALHPTVFRGAIPINAATFLDAPDLAQLAFMAAAPPEVPGVGSDIKQPRVVELAYPVIPVPAVRQIYGLMSVTRELLPRVVCPTLIFQSREDHVVTPANGPFILERIGAQDKRLIWLDDSYHVATLDNDKELIAATTVEFIRAHV
jgi:carboxylesterase